MQQNKPILYVTHSKIEIGLKKRNELHIRIFLSLNLM